MWFESDRQFSEADLLEVYAAGLGQKPSERWLETRVAQGVHTRTIHGRPGQQKGGRTDGTFAAPQLRLAEIIAKSGVAMFAPPHDRCELVLRAWSRWGPLLLPIEQARAALMTCRKTKRPGPIREVLRRGRELADWLAGPHNSLSPTERKRLSKAHAGEVFEGRVEPRNRDAFTDQAYVYDRLHPMRRPTAARVVLRQIEAACGAGWFGAPGYLRAQDVFGSGRQLEKYDDVRLEQARVLYRFLTIVYEDAQPLLTFLGLGSWLEPDWPRQHAYECLTFTLGVIAFIPTDALAPLIETFAPHAARDESWPATDRDTRTATSEAITTTIGPAAEDAPARASRRLLQRVPTGARKKKARRTPRSSESAVESRR
jgi:hypothetical protein